jgi:hypothetical protein
MDDNVLKESERIGKKGKRTSVGYIKYVIDEGVDGSMGIESMCSRRERS